MYHLQAKLLALAFVATSGSAAGGDRLGGTGSTPADRAEVFLDAHVLVGDLEHRSAPNEAESRNLRNLLAS